MTILLEPLVLVTDFKKPARLVPVLVLFANRTVTEPEYNYIIKHPIYTPYTEIHLGQGYFVLDILLLLTLLKILITGVGGKPNRQLWFWLFFR